MIPYTPRVQRYPTLARGSTLAARWLFEPQPISNLWVGVRFPHRAGRYRPAEILFFFPGLLEWYMYGTICDLGMGPYPSRVRPRDVSSRGNYRSALALYARVSYPLGDVGGISTPCGAVSIPEKDFSSLGCWSRVCVDGLLTRRWYLILPGCGGNSTPARDEALAARWLYEPQSVSHKGMQVGILHRAARHRSGARIFSSPGFWSCICIDGLPTRRWYLTSMGAAGSRRWLEGQLSQPAGSMSPSQSAVSGCRRGFQIVRGCVNPGERAFFSLGCVVFRSRKNF